MESVNETARVSKKMLWAGYIITALPVLGLLMSDVGGVRVVWANSCVCRPIRCLRVLLRFGLCGTWRSGR